MLINNVTVVDNDFPGTPNGDGNVHPSPQASNLTIARNRPRTSRGGGPSNVTAFCSAASLAPCEQPFERPAVAMRPMTCSADFVHVEPRALRTMNTQFLDALYVLAEGNYPGRLDTIKAWRGGSGPF